MNEPMQSSHLSRKQKGAYTREEILKSAGRIFIEKGFHGASISDIAKQNGINQSLIYHYFKDKQELWRQVKEYFFREYIEGSAASIDAEHGLRCFLEKVCRYGFEYLDAHPDIIRLLSWQRLESEKLKIPKGMPDRHEGIEKALLYLKEKREVHQDLDPRLASLLIRSLIRAPFFNGQSFASDDLHSKKVYLDTVINCLERSLQT